ncbi:uncharacterized protein LOC104581413 [Brachypodium distachyon]|uniref:uncharacterized protein LOC104581413 n=1 Tax=Brachypodium distachyon TaxID=15368 RepID=UPI00053007E0|nr:uncharacterized protein LOC104581413 [Brachypodium distachyon]|eukprot:XP_010227226.1 uncharacterized protein LOC104581413 [Brachypodium distachyon]
MARNQHCAPGKRTCLCVPSTALQHTLVDNLPYDVLENIFTRLPVKSAAHCRCLSRSWASADFVHAYRHLANDDGGPCFFFLPNRTVVICRAVWTTTCTAYAWSFRRPGDDEALPLLGVLPKNWAISGRGCVTRPCHGLVVVEIRDENYRQVYYCVHNPSTCQLVPLPDRCLTGRRWSNSWTDNYRFTIYETLRLGYDARSQKYEVVRVHYRGLPPDSEMMKERKGLLPIVCEIYMVNDSMAGFWRVPAARGGAGAKVPAGWVSSYEPSVYAQGHVHWPAQKQKPKRHPP